MTNFMLNEGENNFVDKAAEDYVQSLRKTLSHSWIYGNEEICSRLLLGKKEELRLKLYDRVMKDYPRPGEWWFNKLSKEAFYITELSEVNDNIFTLAKDEQGTNNTFGPQFCWSDWVKQNRPAELKEITNSSHVLRDCDWVMRSDGIWTRIQGWKGRTVDSMRLTNSGWTNLLFACQPKDHPDNLRKAVADRTIEAVKRFSETLGISPKLEEKAPIPSEVSWTEWTHKIDPPAKPIQLEHPVKPPEPSQEAKELNLDITAERARALHRIVRSMHDGHCPKCGFLADADRFCPVKRVDNLPSDHQCPRCRFKVTGEEADLALAEFRPYLQKSIDIFETWRTDLSVRKG